MRIPRVYYRDYRSKVNITPVSSTKDIMRQVANGEPLALNVTGVVGSYDFDGVDPDLDAELVDDAPNKIEQHLHRDKYVSQVVSRESDSSSDSQPSPAPAPVPSPAE